MSKAMRACHDDPQWRSQWLRSRHKRYCLEHVESGKRCYTNDLGKACEKRGLLRNKMSAIAAYFRGEMFSQHGRNPQHKGWVCWEVHNKNCLLYTSPSPRDRTRSRMPSSA